MNSILQLCVFGVLISAIACQTLADLKIACKDENKANIDWFVAYKLPKNSQSSDPNIEIGGGYTWATERNQNLTLSKQSFDTKESIIGTTLDSFYKTSFGPNSQAGYFIYNDQYDDQNLASRAHAKGVIYFDATSAIWITHSIPHYPPLPSEKAYSLDSSQMKYGQSMICLTLPLKALDQIGNQFLFSWPQVVEASVPNSLMNNPSLAKLIRVINNEKHKEPKQGMSEDDPLAWANQENIETYGKTTQVASFSKHTKFNSDLYSGLVAPALKCSLFTGTWSNGVGGVLKSECKTRFSITNIKGLFFKALNVIFAINSDHSKFAMTDSCEVPSSRAVCIGDTNRMASQFKRGGGTVCILNKLNLHNAYRGIVNEMEACPK